MFTLQQSIGPVQRQPAEDQDDLCYANVSFFKNQEDPLYSNIRQAQPNRHEEEEEDEDEDGVEYSVVKFVDASPKWVHEEFYTVWIGHCFIPTILLLLHLSVILKRSFSQYCFFIHRCQEAVEDSSALYSTVVRTPRVWTQHQSVVRYFKGHSRFPQWLENTRLRTNQVNNAE